jgi:N-formylglutamate deformylase
VHLSELEKFSIYPMRIPLILHIPHASNHIPDKTGYIISDDELNQEMLLLTDWFTDDLFSFNEGVTVQADFNRVFCDVERFADDEQGMGVTYTMRDDGTRLREITKQLKSEILNNYYYPHHERLTKIVDEQLNLHDRALIIDCHSFSSKPFLRDLNKDMPRPDICFGIDEYHTPRALYKLPAAFSKIYGYQVRINEPYSGSIVPMAYYQQDRRVMSLMIEINRDLYLKPGTNQKSENYYNVKTNINQLLSLIYNNDYDIHKVLPFTEVDGD